MKNKKVNKYMQLAGKAQTEHHMEVKIIPTVIEEMDTIPQKLKNYISTFGIPNIKRGAPTVRILRNVFSLKGQGLP